MADEEIPRKDRTSRNEAKVAREVRGCLPAALAGSATIIALTLIVVFGWDYISGSDDGGKNGPTTSAASTNSTPDTTTTDPTPTDEPTPTVDPGATIGFKGGFDVVDGQAVDDAFQNIIVLQIAPEGLSGEMNLVADSTLNFDKEEPVCISFAVDLNKSPVTVRSVADDLEATGPVDVVVGFSEGHCTNAPPDRTDTRNGSIEFTYTPGAHTAAGQILLEDSSLGWTVVVISDGGPS